ncbi:MAG TPA: hypothetical protein VFQ47_01415 [Nitrososphaera sp.]|jgi:hypothetical protein|nr:hypothetical protein [Nitrososphaera sp.]
MSRTANYSEIDPIIYAWAQKYSLHIHTKYKDYDVRSIDMVGSLGKRYQIWLDAPDERKEIGLHAWDYKKRKVEVKSSTSDLGENLEKIYATVVEWDADFASELSKHRQ